MAEGLSLLPRALCIRPRGGATDGVRAERWLFLKAGVSVFVLSDADKDGVIAPTEISQFAFPTTGTNHGVAISNGYVYASSDTTIVRYPYKDGDKVATAPEEVVVHDMPASGHYTRTLAFDSQGRLYVNVGSAGNVDSAPSDLALRGMIRRFTLPKSIPSGGLDYTTGEVWAYGLRNEVGVAIDSQDHVWSVENGRDDIYDNQFGAIANDNPAEEINRLDALGPRFFGYPYCWTEWLVDGGLGPGTSWGDDEVGPTATIARTRRRFSARRSRFKRTLRRSVLQCTNPIRFRFAAIS